MEEIKDHNSRPCCPYVRLNRELPSLDGFGTVSLDGVLDKVVAEYLNEKATTRILNDAMLALISISFYFHLTEWANEKNAGILRGN